MIKLFDLDTDKSIRMNQSIGEYMGKNIAPVKKKALDRNYEIRKKLFKIYIENISSNVDSIPNYLKMNIPLNDPKVYIQLRFPGISNEAVYYNSLELQEFDNISVPVQYIEFPAFSSYSNEKIGAIEYVLTCMPIDLRTKELRLLFHEKEFISFFLNEICSSSQNKSTGGNRYTFYLNETKIYYKPGEMVTNYLMNSNLYTGTIEKKIKEYCSQNENFYMELVNDIRKIAEKAIQSCISDVKNAFEDIFRYMKECKEKDIRETEKEEENEYKQEEAKEEIPKPSNQEIKEILPERDKEQERKTVKLSKKKKKEKEDEDGDGIVQLLLFDLVS